MANSYVAGLEKNPANFVPLFPLSFIARQYIWKKTTTPPVNGHRRADDLRAAPNGHQGVPCHMQEGIAVLDPAKSRNTSCVSTLTPRSPSRN